MQLEELEANIGANRLTLEEKKAAYSESQQQINTLKSEKDGYIAARDKYISDNQKILEDETGKKYKNLRLRKLSIELSNMVTRLRTDFYPVIKSLDKI